MANRIAAFFVCWLFLGAAAHAQQNQCRTSPVGASTPYCASEAFVTESAAGVGITIGLPVNGGSNGCVVYDLAGAVACSTTLIRTRLPGGTTNFFVNSSGTGCGGAGCSDSNSGLTALTAKKTLLGALYGVINGYDFTCSATSQSVAQINMLASEINAGAPVHFGPHDYVGACTGSSVTIDGGGFTLQYDDSSGNGPLSLFFGPAFQVQNITFANSLGPCITEFEHASIRFGVGVVFGNCAIGLVTSSNSVATFLNNFTISTNTAVLAFLDADQNSTIVIDGVTGTCTGSPTYTWFAIAQNGGAIALNGPTWTGCGGVSGAKYIAINQGMIYGGAAGLPGSGGTTSGGGTADGSVVIAKLTFVNLPACNSTTEGEFQVVIDSTTTTWGAPITGGGSNRVLAYCNSTAWTVAAK